MNGPARLEAKETGNGKMNFHRKPAESVTEMPLRVLRGLGRDRKGNFAMMAAILMVPVIGVAGLAIDYTNMLNLKGRVSESLDAAAFEAAKLYMKGESAATIQERAGQLFASDLGQASGQGTPDFKYLGVQGSGGTKVVQVTANVGYKPIFMPFLWSALGDAQPTLAVGRQSEVSLSASTVEVALVLDNSGSMAGSKIAGLKTAAKQLVDNMFTAAATPGTGDTPVQMSIVPFAASVNVGPDNKSAGWMDTNGVAKYHHENFDWSTLPGATEKGDGSWELNGQKLTRFWLYNKMNVAWGGCVEARPYPYNVNDAAADPSVPDTLFVPMFAPDEPDSSLNGYGYYNSYLSDDVSTASAAPLGPRRAKVRKAGWGGGGWGGGGWGGGWGGSGGQQTKPTDLQREQNMTKYSGRPSYSGSPNESCTTKPILPMSTKESDIKAAIDSLQAGGNTDIPEGIAWGLHTLTPGAPFNDDRPFGQEGNIKALVVMTDGANTYSLMNNINQSTYAAYGYAAAGHVYDGAPGAKSFTDAMDTHLLQVCQTAKDKGVKVFTIAFDVSNDDSGIKGMLENCASEDVTTGGKLYFDAKNNGSDLQNAFGQIGAKISKLRLYR